MFFNELEGYNMTQNLSCYACSKNDRKEKMHKDYFHD